MIAGYIALAETPNKEQLLWWHKAGLQFTASGYGRRIPSTRMVRYLGRWRRVYVCCYSNSGTAYIEDKDGNWLVIRD